MYKMTISYKRKRVFLPLKNFIFGYTFEMTVSKEYVLWDYVRYKRLRINLHVEI